MYRKVFNVLSFVLVLAVAVSTVGLASAQSVGGGRLSKHDRELLAQAIANGETSITLLFAAQRGSNKSLAKGIESLGGTVRFRDDDIDYIRAIVPIGNAEAAASLNGVQAI